MPYKMLPHPWIFQVIRCLFSIQFFTPGCSFQLQYLQTGFPWAESKPGEQRPLLNMNSTASFWLQQILFFYLMSSRSIPAMSSKCLLISNVHVLQNEQERLMIRSHYFLKGSSHQGIRYLICISDLACWYETGTANLSTNSYSRYQPTIISTEDSTLVTQTYRQDNLRWQFNCQQ